MSDEWIDAPNGDGFWWRIAKGVQEIVEVENDGFWRHGVHAHNTLPGLTAKWQRVKPHSPVPEPLPNSKQVTLTARVKSGGVDLYLDGTFIGCQPGHEAALREVRKRFGIEPEVQGE